MRLLAALTAMMAAGAALAAGQAGDWADDTSELTSGFEESKAICRSVRTREPPAGDRPDPGAAAALKGCDSEALYYGIGMKADPVKARQCAFLERESGDEQVLGGSVMLMTIYANGIGARRDLDVATHLACGLDGAPMESDGRIRHLAELKAQNWTGSDFHYCDDITSGLSMGYCAAHQARIDGEERKAALAALIAGWSDAERQALARLRQAHEAFVSARSDGEIDLNGTARAAMQIAAEEKAEAAFLDTLRRLAAGGAPAFSPADYRAADAALNAAYRETMAALPAAGSPDLGPGSVTREGVRAAQRAWLRYRDAFLAFARVKFPDLASDSLAAWLTRQRIEMLAAEE